MDFIPEAIAMGAILTIKPSLALLLAILIGAQNLPEGFNADREMAASTSKSRGKRLLLFMALVPAGPIAAMLGMTVFADWPALLGALMLFSAGGILYLMFQDIAPQVPDERHWSPPLGAILGFAFGLGGHILTA